MNDIKSAAAALGSLGGKVRSEKKKEAATLRNLKRYQKQREEKQKEKPE